MASISDFEEKIKPFYTLILLVVVAGIFFALGRLSALEERHTPIRITTQEEGTAGDVSASQTASVIAGASTDTPKTISSDSSQSGEVIGSASGKKYYFPWCGTVSRIKPENQVHFASIADARAAGYAPGGNCKGLK